METIIVGKAGNQKIAITDLGVSRKHCQLTEQPDGTFILEDLGSTNGTFVNGGSIVKTRVSRETVIQLGPRFKVKVADLVPEKKHLQTPPPPPPSPTPEPDYTEAFNRLQTVYEEYSKQKVTLQKDARKKNQMKSLPMFAVGLISLLLSSMPGLSDYRLPIVLIATAIAGWGAKVAFGTDVDFPEKMEALTKQFKIDYVCPKCGNFLGDTPFENLRNRKTCGFCKCKWVK